jgi:DNA-binding response OmpR family regulator
MGQPQEKRILIVDDDVSVATALKRLLCAQGYAVETANSCDAALTILQRQRFDLYIVDIRLPDGGGCELLGRMQSVRPAPAIAVSSDAEPHHIARASAAGFVDYLPKPVHPERLRERVQARLSA